MKCDRNKSSCQANLVNACVCVWYHDLAWVLPQASGFPRVGGPPSKVRMPTYYLAQFFPTGSQLTKTWCLYTQWQGPNIWKPRNFRKLKIWIKVHGTFDGDIGFYYMVTILNYYWSSLVTIPPVEKRGIRSFVHILRCYTYHRRQIVSEL